jgi:hypothetical protein
MIRPFVFLAAPGIKLHGPREASAPSFYNACTLDERIVQLHKFRKFCSIEASPGYQAWNCEETLYILLIIYLKFL